MIRSINASDFKSGAPWISHLFFSSGEQWFTAPSIVFRYIPFFATATQSHAHPSLRKTALQVLLLTLFNLHSKILGAYPASILNEMESPRTYAFPVREIKTIILSSVDCPKDKEETDEDGSVSPSHFVSRYLCVMIAGDCW